MGGMEDELKDLQNLRDTLNLSQPAKGFIEWNVALREGNLVGSLNLTEWGRVHEPISEMHDVPGTELEECRVKSVARLVIRGVIQYYFDMLDRDKGPKEDIKSEDINITVDMKIWVANVVLVPLSDGLRSSTLSNLGKIVGDFVGEPTPKDIKHLLKCICEAEKTNYMKDVLLIHPSLYSSCTLSAYVEYLYYYHDILFKHKNKLNEFLSIVKNIEDGKEWEKNIRSKARNSPSWIDCLDRTIGKVRNYYGKDYFGGEVGLLIFMRSVVRHYNQKMNMEDMENELYVMFPEFVSDFVKNLVKSGKFKDLWLWQ
ncbi:uncharacterized protein LOC132642236 [Lycium barbarum]|uniref:uncharacterized protein LOC132642236 n=1 Tax=Lycium barbarum TaxID=112863 RepID=UPI00293F4D22|nr:uncharacterized protein LOC132642236 [Lycium barbarum]